MQLDTRIPMMMGQAKPIRFQPESQLESLAAIAPGINAMRQMQAQEAELADAARKQQAFRQFQDEVSRAFPGGVRELARVFMTKGVTQQHFETGQKLMQMALEEDERGRIFGGGGAPAAAMPAQMEAPAAPTTMQMPVSEVAPEMDLGATGGAQPRNAMMAMEMPAPAARAAAPAGMMEYAGKQYSPDQVSQMLQSRNAQLQQLGRAIADANKPQRETQPEKLRMMRELGFPMNAQGLADFEAAQRSQQMPADYQNYLQAKKEGYGGNFFQYQQELRRAGASSVVVGPQEKSFETALGSGQAKKLLEDKAVADDARDIIATVQQGRQLLQSGMITGFGAEFLTNVGAALNQAGINFAEDRVANTQAFAANMAANVGRIIKQFGAGTGLSNADREYAEKMAGGKVTLDRKAIERILDINERAARNVIKLHNERVKGIKTNIPLTVEIPPVQPAGAAPSTAGRPSLEQILGPRPAAPGR